MQRIVRIAVFFACTTPACVTGLLDPDAETVAGPDASVDVGRDADGASLGDAVSDARFERDATTTSDVSHASDAGAVTADAATVSVRITSPANGATVSGVVQFAATATASAPIARVAFYSAGGGYLIAEDTTAPYSVDWFTAGVVPDGTQRLRAVAFDTTGQRATQEIVVSVHNAAASTLDAGEIARLTAWFEARRSSRYMETGCHATTYTGWTGVPLQMCRYHVSDVYSGGTRWADVILADAEPAQLARWVVQAAIERRGHLLRSDTDALCARIIEQSGAQFPVAGVVYEDMDGTGQKIYPFRNGVTVVIDGLPYGTHAQPTAAQMEAYRASAIGFVGHYGRVVGTMPDEWTALTHEAVAGDRSNWPDIVGRAYRAAWGNDRNALLVAWARANLP